MLRAWPINCTRTRAAAEEEARQRGEQGEQQGEDVYEVRHTEETVKLVLEEMIGTLEKQAGEDGARLAAQWSLVIEGPIRTRVLNP